MVTSEVFDIFPPEDINDDDEVAIRRQAAAAEVEVTRFSSSQQGSYELVIRGEEEKVRAFLDEVGWGPGNGWELVRVGNHIVFSGEKDFLKMVCIHCGVYVLTPEEERLVRGRSIVTGITCLRCNEEARTWPNIFDKKSS